MTFRLFVLLFSLCWAFPVFSNQQLSIYDYDIKQWTAVDGLSNNSVRAITQDRQGYLWIGTLTGLNRFDGNAFEVFTAQQHRHLMSNAITRLFTDSQGYIWIGTRAGLSGVNPETLKFDRYAILAEVSAIVEVSPQLIWVAADHLFQIQDGKISRVSAVKEQVNQLEVDDGHVWVTTNKWLYKVALDLTVERYPLPADVAQRPIYDLQILNNRLHLATEQGYFHLNDDKTIVRCSLPVATGNQVYKIFRDQQQSDWVSSFNQLFHRHQGQPWQVVSRDELGSATLFNDIYQDRQQNVWLGSFGDGLYRASRSKIKRVIPKELTDPIVRSIHATADGQLLIAGQHSLGLLNTDRQFTALPLSDGEPLTTVQDIYQEGDDWLLATDSGPMRYQAAQGSLLLLTAELAGIKTRVMQPRLAGGVWIGTDTGLYSYQQQQLTEFNHNNEFDSSVITFIADETDKMLIGTTRGGYQYQQQKLVRLGLGTELYNAFISQILLLKDGTLLVATLDDGLFVRNFSGKWLQFDRANGLPFEPIVSLTHDEITGFVWASTLEGIFRFQPQELLKMEQKKNLFEQILTPYDRQLGTAPGRCCNGFGHSKVAQLDQELWFPTLKGLVTVPVNFKNVVNQHYQPIVQKITATQDYQITPSQQRVVFETDERNLTIHYTAIEFLMSEGQEFRYQLQGFDAGWHHVGSRRQAIYTNLPPGNFQFILQSRLNNQHWELAQQTELTLVIPKRFDETILYRGLWLLLILILLYGAFWLVRRNIQAREVLLTKQVKQRTQELEDTNVRLNALNEQLSQLTLKDPLTGLRNRRFMFEQLPKDTEHYQRNRESMLAQNKCIALILLDMDHFKIINDQYGNTAGDGVLQQISGLLIRETRGSDYVVRFAGEQFMVVLRDTPHDLVRTFSLRINEAIANERFVLPDGRAVNVNCSVGYAIYPLNLLGAQLISWEISLQLAELALYHVKMSGRNGVATLSFDQQVDAFEFEDRKQIDSIVERFLADGLAWFDLTPCKIRKDL